MPELVVSPIDDEICLRVGRIITRWGVVEKLTSWLLGTLLMADQGAMLVLTNTVSASTQSKWIRVLMSTHEHEAAQNARIADLLTRSDDLRAERNEYVHGVWNPEGCERGTAEVETVNLGRSEIMRTTLVTTGDLDHHLNDVNAWIEDYIALGRELGFPRQRGEPKSMFSD